MRSPSCTRNPSSRNDPLFTGTDPVRRLSDEIGLQQTFGDAGAPTTTGGKPGSSICRAIACSRTSSRAAARRTATASRATSVLERARPTSARGSTSSAWPPTPTSRRSCSRSCAGALERYAEMKAQGRRARLSRSAARRARPRARQPPRARGLPAALQAHLRRRVPGHRSAAGRDPPAARRRRPGRDRLAPGQAAARPAVPRRRSQAVDLPLPPRRRRDLPRGVPARSGAGAPRSCT